MLRALLLTLAAISIALVPGRCEAKKNPDHIGAGVGGGVAGLVCGGGTLVYAQLRTGGRELHNDDPMLWHQAQGPAVLGAFFLEHGAVGGLTGALGDGPRAGFLIGGAVTCTLDIAWIIASEVIAANSEPAVALLQHDPAGWRMGVPRVAIRPEGATAELFAVRF